MDGLAVTRRPGAFAPNGPDQRKEEGGVRSLSRSSPRFDTPPGFSPVSPRLHGLSRQRFGACSSSVLPFRRLTRLHRLRRACAENAVIAVINLHAQAKQSRRVHAPALFGPGV